MVAKSEPFTTRWVPCIAREREGACLLPDHRARERESLRPDHPDLLTSLDADKGGYSQDVFTSLDKISSPR